MIRYKHSQLGWVVILITLVVGGILLITALSNKYEERLKDSLLLGAFIVLLVQLLFHSLKVEVTDEDVNVAFGVGVIKRTIPLERIQSCSVVRNSWVLGWGIRFGFGFTLWNVSGFESVELTFHDTKWKFRIGTDQPEELCETINAALRAQ